MFKVEFFKNPQWAGLADWENELDEPYATAERMLGVNTVPFESPGDLLLQDYAASLGVEDTFVRTPVAVFFGESGEEVPDPYFTGNFEEALDLIDERPGAMSVEFLFAPETRLLRQHSRFAEIVRELELDDYWSADPANCPQQFQALGATNWCI